MFINFHHAEEAPLETDAVLVDDQRLHLYDRVLKAPTGYWWTNAYMTLDQGEIGDWRERFEQTKKESLLWPDHRDKVLSDLRLYLLRSKRSPRWP